MFLQGFIQSGVTFHTTERERSVVWGKFVINHNHLAIPQPHTHTHDEINPAVNHKLVSGKYLADVNQKKEVIICLCGGGRAKSLMLKMKHSDVACLFTIFEFLTSRYISFPCWPWQMSGLIHTSQLLARGQIGYAGDIWINKWFICRSKGGKKGTQTGTNLNLAWLNLIFPCGLKVN